MIQVIKGNKFIELENFRPRKYIHRILNKIRATSSNSDICSSFGQVDTAFTSILDLQLVKIDYIDDFFTK